MRINRDRCKTPRGRALHSVSRGTTVSFCKQFHQDHCLDDIFLVVDDNGYITRYNDIHPDKMCVVNIATGKMSVVDKRRECHVVKGEFCVDHR